MRLGARCGRFSRDVIVLAVLSLVAAQQLMAKPVIINYTYAVVISKEAYDDPGWKAVADSLIKKHGKIASKLFTWTGSVSSVKSQLADFMPNYIAFVARPVTECNTGFVKDISIMTRALDSDPYGDAIWGVVTGYEAADALRAVSESVVIKTVVEGSGNHSQPPRRYYQSIGLPCDSYEKTEYSFSDGKQHTANQRPDGKKDRVPLICSWFNTGKIKYEIPGQGTIDGTFDMLVTGGHGNIDTWQCHYPDAGQEGYINSSKGQLFGAPSGGSNININSTTPKVYIAASNCLIANPDEINNLVYAWFHTGHAINMNGFIPECGPGMDFMGWGVYDRFTKFASYYNLAESFYYGNNNTKFELDHSTGIYYMSGVTDYWNTTVVYGDPKADAYLYDLGDSSHIYLEKLSYTPGAGGNPASFEYKVTAHATSLVADKWYFYQLRPMHFLPVRIDASTVAVASNDGKTAVITDNFILWEMLGKDETLAKGASKTIRWTAKVTGGTAGKYQPPEPTSQTAPADVTIRFGREGLIIHSAGSFSGDAAVSIVNARGGRIFSGNIGAGDDRRGISAADMPSGVYCVIIQTGDRAVKKRVAFVR